MSDPGDPTVSAPSSVPEDAPSVPERAQRDEGRPRPQYGEYATPEEQRARIRQPDATWAIDTGRSPDAAPAASAAPPVPKAPATPLATAGRGRLADRIVTFALLAYGLLNVVSSVPLMFALAEGADGYLGLVGMTEPLSDRTAAQVWGTIAGCLFIIGWLVTAWLSLRRVRRGRVAFWIPLVGAVVTSVIVMTCILVPALGDPAFLAFLEEFAANPPLP